MIHPVSGLPRHHTYRVSDLDAVGTEIFTLPFVFFASLSLEMIQNPEQKSKWLRSLFNGRMLFVPDKRHSKVTCLGSWGAENDTHAKIEIRPWIVHSNCNQEHWFLETIWRLTFQLHSLEIHCSLVKFFPPVPTQETYFHNAQWSVCTFALLWFGKKSKIQFSSTFVAVLGYWRLCFYNKLICECKLDLTVEPLGKLCLSHFGGILQWIINLW